MTSLGRREDPFDLKKEGVVTLRFGAAQVCSGPIITGSGQTKFHQTKIKVVKEREPKWKS